MFNTNIEIKTESGRSIVAPVSLNINHNDKIALIGEEGNGKSSFLNALLGENPDNMIMTRSISNPNIIFGVIRQSLNTTVLNQSINEYIFEDSWEQYGEFTQLFHEFLPYSNLEDCDRLIASFSNGERLRIQVIKLLLQDVDCYLLDEPTNDLDMDALLWFEEWLLKQEKPILMVSHDLRLIENFANKIVHFEQIKRKTKSVVTVYTGTYESYMTYRNAHIAHQNNSYQTRLREKKKQEKRWRELYHNVSNVLQATKGNNPSKGRLLKKKMNVVKSMKVRMDQEDIGSKHEFESGITLRFDTMEKIHHKLVVDLDLAKLEVAGKVLATNIQLQMYSKDKIAIIGRNGVGKSTLLKYIAEHYPVSVMHQDYSLNLNYDHSTIENLWLDGKKETLTLITTRLGNLNFTESEMHALVGNLSGGQKAKVSLLKCVLENSSILLLDEPTRNLSPLSVDVIYDMVKDFPGAILAITHDRAFIDAAFSDVLLMDESGLHPVEKKNKP